MKTTLLNLCAAAILGTTLVSCGDTAPPPPPPPPTTVEIHHYHTKKSPSDNPEDFQAVKPPHSFSQ